jgi:hypothetical protein
VKFFPRLRGRTLVRYASFAFMLVVALLAAAIVASVTIDLGPAVRQRAERAASEYIERPMHIGSLKIRLLTGEVLIENLTIDGLHAGDRPFFTARRLAVSMDWLPAFARRPDITISAVEMSDWHMLVEKWESAHNFPRFNHNDGKPPGPQRVTTTLRYLRASRGEFTFEDHETPWSVVCRNLEIDMGNLPKYHGTATFSGGTVAIQHYVPFSAKMRASFFIDEGRIHLDRVEFDTDGAKTVATGVVDVRHWP